MKIGIGATALALFLVYMLVVGASRAPPMGERGDLTEYEAGTPSLVAGLTRRAAPRHPSRAVYHCFESIKTRLG